MTRVLLFGSGGQIGAEVVRQFERGAAIPTASDGPPACELFPLARGDCDLSDARSVREAIARVDPRVIVNAAAWTAVDRAETDPAACARINAEAPAIMADEARARGALLVHYSTE